MPIQQEEIREKIYSLVKEVHIQKPFEDVTGEPHYVTDQIMKIVTSLTQAHNKEMEALKINWHTDSLNRGLELGKVEEQKINNFILSLTICDNLGDVWDDVNTIFLKEDEELKNADKENYSEDDEEDSDFVKIIRQRGAKYNFEL
jgi:hypothetical protein